MPTKHLPLHANLDHLKYQAKDLLKGHHARSAEAAQRIREFYPSLQGKRDEAIFSAQFGVSSAQLTIAREYGFASWARLKAHVAESPLPERSDLPHHERIEDARFRHAVDLLDVGDAEGLRAYLKQYPDLVRQRVVFEGGNYFRNPSLLEFVAENPIRRGSLPGNIVAVAEVLLEAGAERAAVDETLMLVSSGCVARECGAQIALIDLLCDHGADLDGAMQAAIVHGEVEAVRALVRRGARVDLPVAVILELGEVVQGLLPGASREDRHRALAVASQFGHVDVVRRLLDAGEDPNRYNPVGFHSHATPLHQAALAGHGELVRLLVERGASVTWKDVLWQGTPADWARHAGRTEIAAYLDEAAYRAIG